MSDISSAIVTLLYAHDCVIVPGLGAFLSRRVGSRFDEQKGLMFPPRKEVIFNSDIRHTDGILADHLCGVKFISYEDASSEIEAFVADVMAKMQRGTMVMIPNLGSLRMMGCRIIFEPAANLNVLIGSYGLVPVAAQRVRSEISHLLRSSSARKAAASAAAVVLLLLVSPRTNEHSFVQADLSSVFSNRPSAFAAQSEEAAVESAAPATDELSAAVAEDHVGMVARQEDVKKGYHVIVASFLTRQEADDYIASMRARGMCSLQVLDYGGRCRVSASKFDNSAEAQRLSRKLRSMQGFEKTWVFHIGR